jgi:hypothetical protein
MLEKTARRSQKIFDESKDSGYKKIEIYENILKSKETSEIQKVKALLGRMLEYDRLERLSSQLSLLYILQMFAFKVKVMKISIDNINEQLTKSGILEKTKDIEDIKNSIDMLRILIEAQYESIKEIGDNRSRDLTYVS